MTVTANRWTCPHPSCRRTVTADDLSRAEAVEHLRAARAEHADRHAAEDLLEVATTLAEARP